MLTARDKTSRGLDVTRLGDGIKNLGQAAVHRPHRLDGRVLRRVG